MIRVRRQAPGVLCILIFSSLLNPPGLISQEPPTAQAPVDTQRPEPIRVSVDRVNVGVLVTDPSGKFAEGLQRNNFHIFDNGVEQPITDFLDVEEPAQTVVLIEAGPAVYLLEGSHLRAAQEFLRGLSPEDRVAVVKYAGAPQGLVDFTANKQFAAAAFDELGFNLGFGSLNLSASLSKVLDWLTTVQGKKTIVLLSTGVDTSSTRQIQDLLSRLQTSEVRILAVSLTADLRNPPPAGKKKSPSPKVTFTSQQFAEADMLLRQIAQTTGGQAYFPAQSSELPGVFAEIAQMVRHEFSLAFVPPAHDGAVHSLEVRVTAKSGTSTGQSAGLATGVAAGLTNYRVDCRHAYLAPRPVTR
jgi:VWFA-related protein